MRPLSDAVLAHLREVVDQPDLLDTRYELLERIGRGGMGTVYRVRDRELFRQAALKVMDLPPGSGSVVPDALSREARVLASLEHPGIVPVHDLGRLPDGRPFYVMKLVQGRRLDEHAREETSLVGRLRVFERICEAVSFAHARGVIHRDLKPENVMVGPFGEVLVMDWGTAKVLSAPASAEPAPARAAAVPGGTVAGTVMGTPGYMSPEQERGETDGLDGRTDVYALGAVLRFLLGGAPETDLPASVPVALRAVCDKALAADRDRRYARVADLAQDVSRYLAGLSVTAHREGVLEWLSRLARKYRTPLLLVLAYLLVRVLLLLTVGV